MHKNGHSHRKHRRNHKHADVFKHKTSSESQQHRRYQSADDEKPLHDKWISSADAPMIGLNTRGFGQQKPQQKTQQHIPVHIMDLDVNEMVVDVSDDGVDQVQVQHTFPPSTTLMSSSSSSAASSLTPSESSSTTLPSTAINLSARVHDNVLNSMLFGKPVILNDKVTSISVIDRNDNSPKLFIGSSRVDTDVTTIGSSNVSKPVILIDKKLLAKSTNSENSNGNDSNDDADASNEGKGYYEKTIVNKNGVFIENIRKISNIDQRIFGSMDDDTSEQPTSKVSNANTDSSPSSTGISDNEDEPNQMSLDNYNGKINRKTIELMNNVPVGHAQHYVITSSGKIEQTNTLANDDVIGQFQGGLSTSNGASKAIDQMQQQSEQIHQNFPMKLNDDVASFSSSSSATGGSTTPFGNVANTPLHREILTGGTFLTTVNSAVPALVTTSTLSDTTNTNCIVMGEFNVLLSLAEQRMVML